MSDLQFIEQTLATAARKRRKERAFRGFCIGFLVGSLVWLLALAIYKLAPIPEKLVFISELVAAACPLIGGVIGGWRRNSMRETARWLDSQFKLKERLASAMEIASGTYREEWKDLVLTDAARHAKGLEMDKAIPLRVPKATRWALRAIALAVGLIFVPEYRSKAYVKKTEDIKLIKEAGRQLSELTKRNMTNRPPSLETTQKSMDSVGELGSELSRKNLTRAEALKDIAKVTDQIKEQLNDLSQNPGLKRMAQDARAPEGQTSPEAAKLQKQIAETEKQLGDQKASPEDMDKLQKQLDKIQEAAKAAAAQNGGQMSQQQKENLSKSLSALSKQAQEMGMQTPNLDQAIQALNSSQADLMLKDLQQASFDLQKTKEMAKSLQQMQQQMEKMGKDLAEQLKNGQPEEAQSTLQKMMDQLKSANLTPEQLKKMLSEVSKAVDPASKYGKVGEHLKKAAESMQKDQKSGASKSLSDAAKELAKLQEQMNDATSLSAELDALNQASASVGTGQSWSKCQGQGSKPGFGKGGKPGSGVGTWADEDSGWGAAPAMTDHWDNTGKVRPDTDPKGLTDRPADMNDALKPTKVKGQFSPGGQMPSITLKGVSIKGQSKVQIEEASVSAQADAQSALNQEKVPRAYQGAVRDYFDDLKK